MLDYTGTQEQQERQSALVEHMFAHFNQPTVEDIEATFSGDGLSAEGATIAREGVMKVAQLARELSTQFNLTHTFTLVAIAASAQVTLEYKAVTGECLEQRVIEELAFINRAKGAIRPQTSGGLNG